MGRSWSLTTIQAASNWRINSSCPTHWTVSSSGWARWRVTPSISTVMVYPSLCGIGTVRFRSHVLDTLEADDVTHETGYPQRAQGNHRGRGPGPHAFTPPRAGTSALLIDLEWHRNGQYPSRQPDFRS